MKPFHAVLALLALASQPTVRGASDTPVSFELAVHPLGVAVQFDVLSSQPLDDLGVPQFEGASAHEVRSAVVPGGTRRFVVYSLTGDPISASGSVTVTFPASFALDDGSISVTNVTASDASGHIVAAAPNALPVLTMSTREHQAFPAGKSWRFPKLAVDPDGAIAELRLQANGADVDSATAAPFNLAWGPVDSGSYTLGLAATDSSLRVTLFDLGVFRAFAESELTDYSSYTSIFYGADAPASSAAFHADPLGIGVPNGLAYLLGIDPHSPDRSRLPSLSVERSPSGDELVVRFVRRQGLEDVQWIARAGHDPSALAALPAERIAESDLGDGTRSVEIRLTVAPGAGYRQFVDIKVSQP